jgi:hypothetical protein
MGAATTTGFAMRLSHSAPWFFLAGAGRLVVVCDLGFREVVRLVFFAKVVVG